MIALRNAFSFAKYTVFPRIPIKLGFYPFFVTHAQCCMNVMCVFILSTSESICANLTIETVVKITFIRDLNILSNKDPFHFMVEYPALKMRQFLAIERSHALGAFGFHLWILFAVQGKGANFVSFSWSVLMLVLRQEIGILTCLTFNSMNRLPWPSSSSQIFSGIMAV